MNEYLQNTNTNEVIFLHTGKSPLTRKAQLAVVPDTDHMMIVKRSDWVVPMVKVFLDLPMPQTQLK